MAKKNVKKSKTDKPITANKEPGILPKAIPPFKTPITPAPVSVKPGKYTPLTLGLVRYFADIQTIKEKIKEVWGEDVGVKLENPIDDIKVIGEAINNKLDSPMNLSRTHIFKDLAIIRDVINELLSQKGSK